MGASFARDLVPLYEHRPGRYFGETTTRRLAPVISNVRALRLRAVKNGPGVVGSITLHGVLVGLLIAFGPDGDSPLSSVPRILRVGIVVQPGADLDPAPIETSSTELIEEAVDLAGSEPDLPMPRADEPTTVSEASVETPARQPADGEGELEQSEPSIAEETSPAPARDEPAEVPSAREPAIAAPTEAQLAVRKEGAPAPPAPEPALPPAEPPAETISIVANERRMLDRKIDEWARSFDELSPSIAWAHEGQTYTATFTRVPATDSMGIDEVLVAVTTAQDGSRWSTEMRMQRLSFSSFAQFVDRWDPQVQIHDDEIDGRFHSNSEIYVARIDGVQPQFRGKVTTARGVDTTDSEQRVVRREVFLGGLDTRAARIPLPRRLSLFEDDDSDGDERVQRFTASTRITFYADGSYGWQELESTAPEQRGVLPDEPQYLVAAEKTALHVRGVVNGKVLVHSPHKIVIEDDLVYAADPVATPGADDYLGLVSDQNVEIAGPEVTGPGDLVVHAAIYAKRRFVVRDYHRREGATLLVYGSVAAGSLSATEPRFATKVDFDERLEQLRPPRFPLTDRYEVAAWDGRWTETH